MAFSLEESHNDLSLLSSYSSDTRHSQHFLFFNGQFDTAVAYKEHSLLVCGLASFVIAHSPKLEAQLI